MNSKAEKYKQLGDQELLQLARMSKDQDALVILYHKYIELVYGSCLKYLKNKEDAKDAVSEIYQLLVEKVPNSKIDDFRPWLYVVVKNHCFGILRKEKGNLTKKSDAEVMYTDQVFHPDDVSAEDKLLQLEKCMDRLDKMQSLSIKSFYFDKMTYEEIAKRMKLDRDKVRSYIQNGRRNLKNCMDKISVSE